MGLPGGSLVKNPPGNAEDMDSIPGSERSPAEGNGNRLQYFWLGNPMDRGVLQSMVSQAVRHNFSIKQQQRIKETKCAPLPCCLGT